MPQIVYDGAVGCDEPADCCKRLGERPHDEVNIVSHAEMVASATAMVAEHAEAMGFVYHDAGVVFLCKSRNLWEVGYVTFHAEHAIDDYQFHFVGVAALESLLQGIHVIVLEFQSL